MAKILNVVLMGETDYRKIRYAFYLLKGSSSAISDLLPKQTDFTAVCFEVGANRISLVDVKPTFILDYISHQ